MADARKRAEEALAAIDRSQYDPRVSPHNVIAKAEAALHASLADDLERIAAKFRKRPRITLLVRQPGNPDGTVFLSDDNYADALAAMDDIQQRYHFKAGPPEPEATR